ncbi:MAG: hypothetical protein RLY58_597 [Pseudomonadota bacterium]|jgi:hypothetical protein
MTIKTDLEQLKADLTQQRDEMKVKMSLAKMEIKDEWQALDDKTQHFFANVGQMTHETAEDVSNATKQLGDDIKQAYAKLKAKLV